MTSRTLPPITGTPLDFVPIDAPVRATTLTVFTAPTIKRAAIAATVAASCIALFAYPVIGLTALALGVVAASVWAGGKLADRLNEHEGARNDNH
ncbi:hypothetical protein [Rhizobium leucaenae]|uniref:hypothetical protein n=1 Tax=Rhizobium leucaenae TaxID=29450 RepID=UPI0007EE8BFB|nr:hypothetical protein [Rhizobium leucaenae]